MIWWWYHPPVGEIICSVSHILTENTNHITWFFENEITQLFLVKDMTHHINIKKYCTFWIDTENVLVVESSGSFGVRGETNMWRSYQMFCLESVTNQRNLFTLKVNRVLWLVIESWCFQINNKSLSPIIYAFSQIWQKIHLVAPSYISLPFHPRRATASMYIV